jgi:hypothetical protein
MTKKRSSLKIFDGTATYQKREKIKLNKCEPKVRRAYLL